MKMKKYFPLFFLVALFLFVRLYNFTENLNFGTDQGMGMLEIYNLYQQKKITLISQTGSSMTVHGRYFYFGSALYYIFMPFLILFHWDPVYVSAVMVFFQLAIFILLYQTIKKKFKNSLPAIIFAVIFAVTPVAVNYGRFFWSPNFMVVLSSVVLYLLLLIKRKKSNTILFLLTGFFLGLGFQIHYSFFLTMLVTGIWLIFTRQINLKKILLLSTGFLLGISPLIIFELRHNFYNLQTLWFYFTIKEASRTAPLFQPHLHYFLNLLPFIFFVICYLLSVIFRKLKYPVYLLLIGYTVWSMQFFLPKPSHGFMMVDGWNFAGEKKAAEIILSEKPPKNYNVVDILTGDTRSMAIRYLLTIGGSAPMGVTEYPSGNVLFITSKLPIWEILKGSLWEIDCIKPVKLVKSWEIQNGIYLYQVEKAQKI